MDRFAFSGETLTDLSEDENLDVRIFVASNPNTPEEVLIRLYEEDLYDEAREAVEHNPNIPDKIFERLDDFDYHDEIQKNLADKVKKNRF